jgi:hypothetical protein
MWGKFRPLALEAEISGNSGQNFCTSQPFDMYTHNFHCGNVEFSTLRGEALADDSGSAIFPETGTVLRHPHRRHEGKSDVKTKD